MTRTAVELMDYQLPGHTPGVLMTEGIPPFTAAVRLTRRWCLPVRRVALESRAPSRGVETPTAPAIQGVQVNTVPSWAEPDGYPGGGVLERAAFVKTRKLAIPIRLLTGHLGWARHSRSGVTAKTLAAERAKAGREVVRFQLALPRPEYLLLAS